MGPKTMDVTREDLRVLLAEDAEKVAKITELQARGTAYENEARTLRGLVRDHEQRIQLVLELNSELAEAQRRTCLVLLDIMAGSKTTTGQFIKSCDRHGMSGLISLKGRKPVSKVTASRAAKKKKA